MEYIEVSAKTKDEAIIKASIELGTSSDNLDIVVLSEGSSGFLGFGAKPAKIKVRRKEEKEMQLEEAAEPVVKEAEKVQEEKTVKVSKPAKEKPVKQEETVKNESKEKPVKERRTKEKAVKEKTVKEKASKPIEIITDAAEIEEIQNRARNFLMEIFQAMHLENVEIKVVYNTEEGCLEADFEGDDMGILIGKRGQTLDSLQYLTSLVVNKGKNNYIRVKLDTEDYRRRRKETLENLARGIAYKVKKTRKPVILEPMNPYERRIIHSALQSNKFVETTSEGEEPYRHVVVKLKR